MDDIDDLYQSTIMDHGRNPKNYHSLDTHSASQEGFNPMCGDHYTIYIEQDGDLLKDISFTGSGCAISMASASLMTMAIKGKKISVARDFINLFYKLVKTGDLEKGEEEILGRLLALQGIREFPMRVKCATLAWHALETMLISKASEQ